MGEGRVRNRMGLIGSCVVIGWAQFIMGLFVSLLNGLIFMGFMGFINCIFN